MVNHHRTTTATSDTAATTADAATLQVGTLNHCVVVWPREPHAHMRAPQAADAADAHRRHAEEAVVALTTQRQTWLAKLSTLQLRVDELTAQLANEQVRNVAVCAASPKSLRR